MPVRDRQDAKNWTFQEGAKAQRLDQFVAQHSGRSVAQVRRLILSGQVQVDGHKAYKGWSLRPGQTIQLYLAAQNTQNAGDSFANIPALTPSEILYQDDEILVVNKPAGLPAQARSLQPEDCLVQRVGQIFPEVLGLGDDPREGSLLHRLDVGTSGAIALARNSAHYLALRQAFQQGGVDKFYLAVVENSVPPMPEKGLIDWPLAHAGRSGRMVAMIKGTERHRGQIMPARTAFQVLQRGLGLSLVALMIRQGRMHQIRAHLSALGFPIYGDATYGRAAEDLSHQALHAWKIELHFDRVKKSTPIVAPLPLDLVELCQQANMPWHTVEDNMTNTLRDSYKIL